MERLGARYISNLQRLPEGFPDKVLGHIAGQVPTFKDESKYLITWSQKDVCDVVQALQYFVGKLFKTFKNMGLIPDQDLPGINGHD